jgi:hypothetical protein
MLLLTVLVWTIWATGVYVYVDKDGKTVSESKTEPPDPKNNFPTRDLCLAEIDKQLDWMEQQGIAKRVSKYEIKGNTPLPYGVEMTTRWECKELPK